MHRSNDIRHSITSSARASNVGCTVRLSVFAAARFLVPEDSIDVSGGEPVQAPTRYELVINLGAGR
jgi:hypothetical protein